jgi:hypothetical protein
VLEADDPAALRGWLEDHGYARSPSLEAWLGPYVEKRWKLTAFKIADGSTADAGSARPAAAQALGTGAVRMSFRTDRPFFPYREPRDQREGAPAGPRSLRVFVVGTERTSATIGDGSTAFAGRTTWSAPFPRAAEVGLAVPVPPGAWLTAIEDVASPRPGVDELWLARAADQAAVKPPPIVDTRRRPIPVPLDLLALVVGSVVVLRVRRRRRGSER